MNELKINAIFCVVLLRNYTGNIFEIIMHMIHGLK